MHVIVVLNRSLVLVVDLGEKLQKFVIVDYLDEIVFLQE
jgi:hypothetical protein